MAMKSAPVQVGSAVTGGTLELLLDLVEIKLGCIEVYDRDDARELKALQKARRELHGLLGRHVPEVDFPAAVRPARVGRRPATPLHA